MVDYSVVRLYCSGHVQCWGSSGQEHTSVDRLRTRWVNFLLFKKKLCATLCVVPSTKERENGSQRKGTLFYGTVHCKAFLRSFTLVQTGSTCARVAPLTEHSKFKLSCILYFHFTHLFRGFFQHYLPQPLIRRRMVCFNF